jgi:hypothetical protein
VKKILLSGLALALMSVGAPLAQAQGDAAEPQPVVVASFSGYAELKRDLEYIGTLAGNPDLAAGLEQLLLLLTQGQGLAGVDQTRPWGASLSITSDGSQFPALVFLPVNDLTKLLDALAAYIGEAVDVGDDIYEIKRNANTYFITQKGKWAYLAQQKSALDELPADPLKQLRGLDKKYDLALSINVQNIPQALRDMAADLIMQGLEARLMQNAGEDDDDEDQGALQAQLARSKAEQLVKRINELDQVTVGLNIDRTKSRTFLDLEVTALPGSDAAKEFAAASSEEAQGTRLAGVLLPEAVFSLHINSPISGDEDEMDELFDNLRTQLMSEIEKEEDLDDDQKETTKELAGKLVDIVEETAEEQERLNAGLVVVGKGPVTVVLGCLVSQGADVEALAKEFVKMAAENGDLSKLKQNIAKHKGFRFHSLKVPVPDDDDSDNDDSDNAEQIRSALGDPVEVTLAFGDEMFYVALGENGVDTIKQVIEGSNETPEEKLPEVMASLALAPIMKLAASRSSNPMAALMAENLKLTGKDHVKITVVPVDNGVRYRIEGEEGINKLLGLSLGNAARGGAAGGK